MGWLIALGIGALLAVLPLGVRFRYDDRGIYLAARVGQISIPILPRKKKKEKTEKKPPSQQKKAASSEKKSEKTEEKGGSWKDFLPLVQVALDFLGGFVRKIRIDHLELKLILAGDDPCDLATNYGRAWAAVGNLMPRLERVFTIRRRKVEVECDFLEDTTRVWARADITITLGRLLILAGKLAFRGLREYWKIKQKRKGGAAK